MIRARTALVVPAALLTLAGCTNGSNAVDQSTTSPTAAATGAPIDKNREVCRKITNGNPNATALIVYGLEAERSADPGIAAAGKKLGEAASSGDQLAINAARRDVGTACASLLGDGPW